MTLTLEIAPEVEAALTEKARCRGLALNAYSMSLADAFCVALAARVNAKLVTSDRHELEPLLDDGVANITFIP